MDPNVEPARNDALLSILSEIYAELRSYRDKEFQTFLFAFPVIGTGFIAQTGRDLVLLSVLTAFAGVVVWYILRNDDRMQELKKTIVDLQTELKLSEHLWRLRPESWCAKPLAKRLGTVSYLVLLVAEVVTMWIRALVLVP